MQKYTYGTVEGFLPTAAFYVNDDDGKTTGTVRSRWLYMTEISVHGVIRVEKCAPGGWHLGDYR